jgi:predicted transcriptional regulator of viral defense system
MALQLKVIDELAAAGMLTFESDDVRALTGQSPQATSNLLTRLAHQGLVDRVARGKYALRPLGALGTTAAAEDIALAVSAVFGERPHRIAYRSALDHHDLLQHPSRQIVLALARPTSLERISGRRLRVQYETADRIAVGAIDAGYGARVSSVERALLESASRPKLAGGIVVVATALVTADPDPRELKSLARRLGAHAALQRLGSLAGALGLEQVAAAMEPSSRAKPVPLDPAFDGEGKRDAWRDDKWDVDWPFSIEELAESVHR